MFNEDSPSISVLSVSTSEMLGSSLRSDEICDISDAYSGVDVLVVYGSGCERGVTAELACFGLIGVTLRRRSVTM